MSEKIVCVVPSIRPERMEKFRESWKALFEKHKVTLITVWDGEEPSLIASHYDETGIYGEEGIGKIFGIPPFDRDLLYRFTDAIRNAGFIYAAQLGADYILTLDDDVEPHYYTIQCHLDMLQKRVPISWMNTAHNDLGVLTSGVQYGNRDAPYLRGVPYGIRDEAPVMLSHGTWLLIPDFDGETQLALEKSGRVPATLPYYRGPVPRGVSFPMCGMNVMIRKEALPYFYFAPMGPDTGIMYEREVDQTAGGTHTFRTPLLNRFADIWCGVYLKREFDRLGWACYTGGAQVVHTRASDAKKNMEQEKLGREWNEKIERYIDDPYAIPPTPDNLVLRNYFIDYYEKRERYKDLITSIQSSTSSQRKPMPNENGSSDSIGETKVSGSLGSSDSE